MSLLLIKITASNFQERFIKAGSLLVSKYLNFYFYSLKVPFIRSWPILVLLVKRNSGELHCSATVLKSFAVSLLIFYRSCCLELKNAALLIC